MKEFAGCTTIALMLTANMAAAAADRIWFPYREACEKLGLTKFHALPQAQRDHLSVHYKVSAGDPALRAVALTIDSRTHAVVVKPDADGSIEFPYDPQLLAENPNVLINLPPEKKLSLDIDLRPQVPSGVDVTYADLMAGVPQANALIRKEAGLMSLFVPTMRAVVLKFDHADGQQLTIGTGAAQKQIRVDARGQIVVPYQDDLASANPRVLISALPQSADFSD